MMADTNVLNTVKHYQKSIEDNSGNPERLLHCIKKLSRLPINITHLSETGIGKTVNSLRKYEGKLGTYANELVLIWKQMVLAEGNISSNPSVKANSADRHKENCDSGKSPEEENMNGNIRNENNHKSSESNSSDGKKKSKGKGHKEKNENENHGSNHKLNLEHHNNNLDKLQYSSKGDMDPKYKEKSRSKHDREHKSSKNSRNERAETLSQKERNTTKEEKKDVKNEKELKKEKNKEKNPMKEQEKDREKRKEQKEKHREYESFSGDKHKKDEQRHGKTGNKNDKEKEKDNTSKKERKIDEQDSGSYNRKADTTSPPKTHNESKTTEDHQKRKEKRSSEEKNDGSSSSKYLKEPKKNRDSVNEEKELNKSHSKKRKRDRDQASENEEELDGIDSSMGANFADVLGMLNMPSKKSKKSISKLSSNESVSNAPKIKEPVPKILPSTSSSSLANRNIEKPSTSSISNLTSKKPELLTSSVKLEPLDPSIVLDLPTISNNYKPLPFNQTVMACVYNTPQVTTRPAMRLMSDSEALSHSIQSKTVRTKVYSGAKSGQCFQPISLFELCVRLLQKNIDALEYTGGVPYEVLSSVLKKATPDQLFRFEEFNPYILEDTDELWRFHVQHNYRTHKRQEMESWREMYLRCREEQERRLSSLTESIKLSTKKLVAPVRKTQLAFVDTLVKPPRNIQRKQEIFGTKAKAVATPAARVAALQQVTPNAAKIGDTRLRVAQSVRDNAQVSSRGIRPKKAPLMQKTLQLMRGRNKR